MTDFDEKSGVVAVLTSWGQWFQTMEEIYLEVNTEPGTRSREIKCDIENKSICVVIKGKTILNGKFPEPVHADDSIWTLEDGKLLRICLSKSYRTADHCWNCLLVDQYEADPFTYNEMQKKLTLESYQKKNPGFDFSGASISGNYHGGGPQLLD